MDETRPEYRPTEVCLLRYRFHAWGVSGFVLRPGEREELQAAVQQDLSLASELDLVNHWPIARRLRLRPGQRYLIRFDLVFAVRSAETGGGTVLTVFRFKPESAEIDYEIRYTCLVRYLERVLGLTEHDLSRVGEDRLRAMIYADLVMSEPLTALEQRAFARSAVHPEQAHCRVGDRIYAVWGDAGGRKRVVKTVLLVDRALAETIALSGEHDLDFAKLDQAAGL